MRVYRWERHDYDSLQKQHVKVEEGEFVAGSLQGAKRKATLKSLVSGKADWVMIKIEHVFDVKGRIHKRQVYSPEFYANINPIVYLYVGAMSEKTS